MTRSALPLAVTVSAALLLTACGGGTSKDSAKPHPPQTPSTSVTSASPTATQAAGPGAPTFALPSGVKVDFSGFDGTGTNKAVLQDATYAATAVVETEALGTSARRTTRTPRPARCT